MATQHFGTIGQTQVRRGDILRITGPAGESVGQVYGWKAGGAVRVFDPAANRIIFYWPWQAVTVEVIGRARYLRQNGPRTSETFTYPRIG